MSCGDPGGIGIELACASWLRRNEETLAPFYLLADPRLVAARARSIGLEVAIVESEPADASRLFASALPVSPLANRLTDQPGRSLPENAAGIVESIDRAVADCHAGKAAAIVTLPIAKIALHEAGFAFPGHTEYLAHLARQLASGPATPVMMLAGPLLRTVPVTVHVPLADVAGLLTQELICETARIVGNDLRRRFGIARPRLAIAGLNPHAGEQGAFGSEEATILQPAIERLRAEGFDLLGPLPADTMFHAEARERYDVALCMYHDQALIPVKTLDFAHTVNVTLGLPFIRTSPDHGTAFDLAGTGKANPSSLIAALQLATRIAAAERASQ